MFIRNPLEVTEEFIQQFNNADTFEEKDRCDELARKMLERSKVSHMEHAAANSKPQTLTLTLGPNPNEP